LTLVLDSSLTLAWAFADEYTAASQAVLDRVKREGAVVPTLWRVEVCNVLVMGERRQRTTNEAALAFLTGLGKLPIIEDNAGSWSSLIEARRLARLYRLTVYDAVYLELALRRSLPLATTDAALSKAAKAAGVMAA